MGEYLLSKVVDLFWSKLANLSLGNEHTSISKSLDNHLRILGARASDFEEQIEKGEMLGTKKRKREVVCWLEQVQSVANEVGTLVNDMETRGFVIKFFREGRATNLDARVSELVAQSPLSDELVADDLNVQGDVFLTEELVGDGFKQDLENIWRLLVIEKVSCIGIHGMGGVGKTTLAKHINNRLVEDNQYRVVWITISEQYSIPKLQDEIAKALHVNISDVGDEDRRSARLNKVLSKLKNVIFILDDVWKKIDLMKLGHPLSIESCRLMITTRSEQVCRQIGCNIMVDVKKLQEDEAWVLFKQIHGPELIITPEVEIIAKSTVKKCKGLPLGIITLAGSMRGETANHAWGNVLAQLNNSVMGQYDMGQDMFKVLNLSFDRLALRDEKRNGYSKSQLCFLYCSSYPEDCEIDRKELIRRFIVEDYLDRKESRASLFNEGHTILDTLVGASLLERGRSSNKVRMHDLLRATALKITEDKTKVFDGHKSSMKGIMNAKLWADDVEKIFLWNVLPASFSETTSPNCPKLSTLSLNCNSELSWPTSFFSQMYSLCILIISGSSIVALPDSLSNMVSLKALLCGNCLNLIYVPDLGKLTRLEELDLSGTKIEEAPTGMEELINLKFLSLHRVTGLQQISAVLNFPNIQCLILPTEIQVQGEQVVALEYLEEFHGWLKDVNHFHELIRRRPKLKYRIVLIPDSWYYRGSWSGQSNKLVLRKYNFNTVKDEDVAMFLGDNIVHLVLQECEWQSKCIVKDVSRMCDPSSLESLEVEGGGTRPWREDILDIGVVTRLNTILPPLQGAIFSSLKGLKISKCDEVKKLGLVPSHFPNLEQLRIGDCRKMEEIIEVEEEHRINDNVFLCNLKFISLYNLSKLKSICNATMVCTSLQSIHLYGCAELKKLPLIFGQPDESPPPNGLRISLKRGSEEWWKRLELGHPTHPHLLKPSFHLIRPPN